MIAAFIGNIGSGKTLSMVKEAYNAHLQGRVVYSNFRLNFPYTPYTVEDLVSWAKNRESLPSSFVLLIDEAHIYLDSRTSVANRNKVITYLLLQTRKMGCDVFFTTQFLHQVDKRLRNLTSHIVECSTRKEGDTTYTLNKLHVMKGGDVVSKNYVFQSNKYFNLYDTYEVVSVD